MPYARADNIDLLYEDIPVVLTPTRLKQSLSDTPASVSVIDSDTIKALGAREIVDVLRIVPGFTVHQRSRNDFRVNYHSGIRTSRRLQVLIDGVSIYQNLIAVVDWNAIPVAIDDIEKIEIIRSPNTAVYGANAFNGVINIITKPTEITPGLQAHYLFGSQSARDSLLRYNGNFKKSHYRITLNKQADNGNDFTSRSLPVNRDDLSNKRFNFQSTTELSGTRTLDLAFFHNITKKQIPSEASSFNELTFPDIEQKQQIISAIFDNDISENQNLKLKLSSYLLDRIQEWQLCVPKLLLTEELGNLLNTNNEYLDDITSGSIMPRNTQDIPLIIAVTNKINSLGGLSQAFSESCGHTNQNIKEQRLNFEAQHTHSISEQLRFVSTLGYTNSRGISATYLSGEVSNHTSYLSTNIEYKPSSSFTLNLGGILEDDNYLNHEFSPRVGINYHLNRQHTLRFIYSKAIRSADLFEQEGNWKYLLTNLSIPINNSSSAFIAIQAQSEGGLSPEKITAKEISYYANLLQNKLILDFKIFEEESKNLISEGFNNDFGFLNLTNNNSSKLKGYEIEMDYRPTSKLSGKLIYSNLDIDTNTKRERVISIKNNFAALLNFTPTPDWQASLVYTSARPDNNAANINTHKNISFNLNKKFKLGDKTKLISNIKLSHFLRDNDIGRPDLYEKDTHYYIGINIIREFN